MANIYSLQLLRNGNPYSSYAEAVAGIKAATTTDGTIKLARYYQDGASGNTKADKYNTNGEIKTIFGIYNVLLGEKAAGYTIFDATHEVLENIQAQIDSITGEGGSVAEQIKAAIDQLNYTGVTTGDGVVVTNVTESSGVVSATSAEVGGLKLTNYALGSDSGAVAQNDTINVALSKLQNQVNKANEDAEEAIKALDANITAENGFIIDHIEQVDGKISGTTKALPSLAEVHEAGKPIIAVSEDKGQLAASAGTINAEFVNVADANSAFTATTVEDVLAEIDAAYKAADAAIVGDATTSGNTLGKLEDRIEELATDAKEYVLSSVTPSSTNVKEAYALFDADGHQSGATINIYKDSAYKEIYLGTSADTINTTNGEITKQEGDKQSLNYAYMKADGTYDLVKVDVSAFLSESEFQSGVTAVNHIVRGVVDPSSETFLTVGADGFKLAGVQDAIDEAVSGASEDLQNAIDELSGKTEALSAKTVTSIASADGSVTATKGTADDGTVSYDLSTDASKVKVSSAYTAGTDTAIATGDTVDAALAKLEAQIAAAKAAATTKVVEGTDAGNNMEIVPTTSSTDSSVTYTINLTDVASDSALTAEIAARKAVDGQSGQTYAANTSANYISGATSLNDADVKLDAAIKAVEDAAGDVQDEVDAIEEAIGLTSDGTYSANTTNNYTSAATSVNGAIDALDDAVKANEDAIDALEEAFVSGATMNGTAVAKANNALAFTANYTNTAANSTDGMVITTGDNGGLTFQFGTLDCGEY